MQKAKEVQHAIEIELDSGRVIFQDLGIDIGDGAGGLDRDGAGGLDGDGGNWDGELELEEEEDEVEGAVAAKFMSLASTKTSFDMSCIVLL